MRKLCRALAAFGTLLIGLRIDGEPTSSSTRFATLRRLNETTHDHMIARPFSSFAINTVASVADSLSKTNDTMEKAASVEDHLSEARGWKDFAEKLRSLIRETGHDDATVAEGAAHVNGPMGIATAAKGAVHSESPMGVSTAVQDAVRSNYPWDIAVTYEGALHSESPMDVPAIYEGAINTASPTNIATTGESAIDIASMMRIATEPYHEVPMSREALERTELFWDVARSEEFTDAKALKHVLQRYGFHPPPRTRYAQMMASEVVDATDKVVDRTGKVVYTTGKVVDTTGEVGDTPGAATDTKREVVTATGEAIHAMLLVRSPADVMRALVSLHTLEDMEKKASVLTRKLLSRFIHLPIVFPFMWMESGLRPEAIFRAFGFDWAKLDRISLTFLGELMMFIGMFRELHPRASSHIDTAELLFASRDGEVLDAHLKEIADQPGYDALARSLRELHNELKDFRSSAKKKIGYFDKMKLRKQCAHAKDVNPNRRKKVQKFVGGKKFWSFAGLEGPINVKELEEFLTLNGKGPDPFVHEWTLIIPLVVVKGIEDVAQALSSLHDLKNNKIDFVKLHSVLVTYCHHFGVSSAGVWMALGLDPQKVYEMLSLHTCVQNELYAATVYEWFKYVEMYRAVHPKCALGFKEARKLLALQHDTNKPEPWITHLEESKNDEHVEFAKMLRKPYDEMLERESSKLLADTGR